LNFPVFFLAQRRDVDDGARHHGWMWGNIMWDNIAKAFRNYATFTGRATRQEFWTLILVMAVCTVGAHFLDLRDGEIVPVAAGMGMLELIAFLLLLLPMISAGARRLHDSGRSAWWWLFFYIPYLGFVAPSGSEQLMIASAAALLIGTAALVMQFVQPGEAGENRFGPEPYTNSR
jgi:uncharacterized membrane protein YhaH (DUF805 family)